MFYWDTNAIKNTLRITSQSLNHSKYLNSVEPALSYYKFNSEIYWHAKVSLHKRNTNIFQNKDHRETKFLCTKHPSVKLAGQPIFTGGSARGVRTGAYLEKHVRSVKLANGITFYRCFAMKAC